MPNSGFLLTTKTKPYRGHKGNKRISRKAAKKEENILCTEPTRTEHVYKGKDECEKGKRKRPGMENIESEVVVTLSHTVQQPTIPGTKRRTAHQNTPVLLTRTCAAAHPPESLPAHGPCFPTTTLFLPQVLPVQHVLP